MARRPRIDWNLDAFDELRESLLEDVKARADAVADACNADSSWGGYDSTARTDGDTARATAWSYGRNDDEARQQRLLKNLGSGS